MIEIIVTLGDGTEIVGWTEEAEFHSLIYEEKPYYILDNGGGHIYINPKYVASIEVQR